VLRVEYMSQWELKVTDRLGRRLRTARHDWKVMPRLEHVSQWELELMDRTPGRMCIGSSCEGAAPRSGRLSSSRSTK
jgi:hypothetical protein